MWFINNINYSFHLKKRIIKLLTDMFWACFTFFQLRLILRHLLIWRRKEKKCLKMSMWYWHVYIWIFWCMENSWIMQIILTKWLFISQDRICYDQFKILDLSVRFIFCLLLYMCSISTYELVFSGLFKILNKIKV